MSEDILASRIVYIYTLADPRTPEEVRYVGVTNNPKRRMHGHLTSWKRERNHRTSWIKSLDTSCVKPIMSILEETSDALWQERERFWITFYKDQGFHLVNTSAGGDGCRKASEETREKLRASSSGRVLNITPETRARMSDKARRRMLSMTPQERYDLAKMASDSCHAVKRRHSDEAKSKMSVAHILREKTMTAEQREKKARKSAMASNKRWDTERKKDGINTRSILVYRALCRTPEWQSAVALSKVAGMDDTTARKYLLTFVDKGVANMQAELVGFSYCHIEPIGEAALKYQQRLMAAI